MLTSHCQLYIMPKSNNFVVNSLGLQRVAAQNRYFHQLRGPKPRFVRAGHVVSIVSDRQRVAYLHQVLAIFFVEFRCQCSCVEVFLSVRFDLYSVVDTGLFIVLIAFMPCFRWVFSSCKSFFRISQCQVQCDILVFVGGERAISWSLLTVSSGPHSLYISRGSVLLKGSS